MCEIGLTIYLLMVPNRISSEADRSAFPLLVIELIIPAMAIYTNKEKWVKFPI